MSGVRATLGEACTLKSGKFVSANAISEENTGELFPCYGGNGVRGYVTDYSHEGDYPIIGRQGALCGNVNYATGKFRATEHAVVVQPNIEMDKRWLYYKLISMNLGQYATGAAQPGLAVSKLEQLPFEIVEIHKQKRIASVFDRLEELISARKQQLEKLDELVKARFVEMFGEPEHWTTGLEKLGDHIDLINGFAFLSESFIEDGIPVIKIRNVNTADFSHGNMQCHPYDPTLDKYLVYPGDLLISLTGTVGKEDFANTCMADGSFERYYLNQRNAKLLPHEELVPEYLLYVLKQDFVKKELIKQGTGVRQCHLHNKDVNDVQLIIPDREMQRAFATFIRQANKSKAEIKKSLNEMEMLKKVLMQKYFG